MRSNLVLMHPSVTRTPDELIKAIGRRRRRQQLRAALPLVCGFTLLALFCAFLLSETGQAWMLWIDGAGR